MSEQHSDRHRDEASDDTGASGVTEKDNGGDDADGFEFWAKLGLLVAATAVLAWAVAWLRLGLFSVAVHAFVIPLLGLLTLPLILWGPIKALFNPPLVRRSRVIAFFALLAVGFVCNVPQIPAPVSTEDFESAHEYRLPFDGEWTVTAGGDSFATNYHATTAAYRWAYDFAPFEDGERHEGEGEELDDYYCYGEPVLASAAGEVVEIDEGYEDNEPREPNAETPLGNYVVLEVDDDEYLYVAHMKEDSLTVAEGDTIDAGQKIGECGNSGRSLEPHVHVHLQNVLDFPMAEGLPLRFSNYEEDGEVVEIGSPEGSTDSDKPADGARVRQR
ncbi:MAG: M23 family metallopeptidase [Persicimonas sp.]